MPAVDTFKDNRAGLNSPFEGGQVVVADEEFSTVSRGLYVGTQGNVAVVFKDGSELILPNVVGLVPVRAKMVKATGTTASNIVAVW